MQQVGELTLTRTLTLALNPNPNPRAVGAPQPWRVLCRDEARLLGRPVTATPPPRSHGDAAANECQSLGRVADLQSRLDQHFTEVR